MLMTPQVLKEKWFETVTVFAHSHSTNKLVNEAANDSARVSGQDRKIPPALGTNQIAGFGGFRPLTSLEKNNMVYPYFSHCNITWTSTCPTRLHILSIVMIQKKLVRMTTFSNYRESSKHLYTSLKIMDINELNGYFVALFMYSFFNTKLTSNFENSFSTKDVIHSHSFKTTYWLSKNKLWESLYNIQSSRYLEQVARKSEKQKNPTD